MAGTPTADQIKYGILRTRDLVELYYQGRMVVQVNELQNGPIDPDGIITILQQDSRRIRYEIIVLNVANVVGLVEIGSATGIRTGNAPFYYVPAAGFITIKRDWRSDLEGVTLEQNAQTSTGTITYYTRATILSPLPADEEP